MTLTAYAPSKYSFFDEQRIIAHWLARLAVPKHVFVDIGAGDGRFSSNTLALAETGGWSGLCVECDPTKFDKLKRDYARFADVSLSNTKITPDNIVSVLDEHRVPRDLGLLSLDIDSHDYFVLEQILKNHRPTLMCVEINEKIPPPVKFAVTYRPDHVWREDHFYGQSLSQLDVLRARHDYAFVELEYANVFMVPAEICPTSSVPADELYRVGYLDRADRKTKFPWNADMEFLHALSPGEQLRHIREKFRDYAGQFVCSLGGTT